jgi:hypothetical protein
MVSDSDDPTPLAMSPKLRRGRLTRVVPVVEESEEEDAAEEAEEGADDDQNPDEDAGEDEDSGEDEDAEGNVDDEEVDDEDVEMEDEEVCGTRNCCSPPFDLISFRQAAEAEDVEASTIPATDKVAPAVRMPLKIKLKLPSTSSSSPAVGEDDDGGVESEDEDDDDAETAGASRSRPLTARQAALAGGADRPPELGEYASKGSVPSHILMAQLRNLGDNSCLLSSQEEEGS